MEAYSKKSLLGVERAMEELKFLSNKKTFVVLHASGAAFHSDGSYAFVVMATYQYAAFAVPSTSAMQPCIFYQFSFASGQTFSLAVIWEMMLAHWVLVLKSLGARLGQPHQ